MCALRGGGTLAVKQWHAVRWVEGMGGTVKYDASGPEWLRQGLGRALFGDVVEVTFYWSEVKDVSPLAGLTKLEKFTA